MAIVNAMKVLEGWHVMNTNHYFCFKLKKLLICMRKKIKISEDFLNRLLLSTL
jgi:hypothetical protein